MSSNQLSMDSFSQLSSAAAYYKAFKPKPQWAKARAVFFIAKHKFGSQKVDLVAIPFKKKVTAEAAYKTLKKGEIKYLLKEGGELKTLKLNNRLMLFATFELKKTKEGFLAKVNPMKGKGNLNLDVLETFGQELFIRLNYDFDVKGEQGDVDFEELETIEKESQGGKLVTDDQVNTVFKKLEDQYVKEQLNKRPNIDENQLREEFRKTPPFSKKEIRKKLEERKTKELKQEVENQDVKSKQREQQRENHQKILKLLGEVQKLKKVKNPTKIFAILAKLDNYSKKIQKLREDAVDDDGVTQEAELEDLKLLEEAIDTLRFKLKYQLDNAPLTPPLRKQMEKELDSINNSLENLIKKHNIKTQ